MRWRALRPTWAKKANARSASRRAGCNRYGGCASCSIRSVTGCCGSSTYRTARCAGLTPVVLVALLPLNVALLWSGHPALYAAILALQCAFYLAALTGWALERSGHRNRLLFIPYYFLFMNLNVFRGASYLATHRGKGAWEKARRA